MYLENIGKALFWKHFKGEFPVTSIVIIQTTLSKATWFCVGE